jgi:hypothetical protein
MKKHDRIAALVADLDLAPTPGFDPAYLGYFQCFNEGHYYEAHDVLEDLWLRGGRADPAHAFYKGLIQLAGAFVHLRKQAEHPDHPKHGRRLGPAGRLFRLAAANLEKFGPSHLGLDVSGVRAMCLSHASRIGDPPSGLNPWSLQDMPQLRPDLDAR